MQACGNASPAWTTPGVALGVLAIAGAALAGPLTHTFFSTARAAPVVVPGPPGTVVTTRSGDGPKCLADVSSVVAIPRAPGVGVVTTGTGIATGNEFERCTNTPPLDTHEGEASGSAKGNLLVDAVLNLHGQSRASILTLDPMAFVSSFAAITSVITLDIDGPYILSTITTTLSSTADATNPRGTGPGTATHADGQLTPFWVFTKSLLADTSTTVTAYPQIRTAGGPATARAEVTDGHAQTSCN